MVVLAHLRRRWSLSGSERFGLAHLALFGEVKCLFSTAPEVGKETETNDGHCGDRTLHRTRPVSSQQLLGALVLGFPTDTSGPSWNQSIRSGTQRAELVVEPTGLAARPVTCDRTRPVAVGAYWTPTGRQVQRVRSNARARLVTATVTSDAHCSRLSCSDRTRPVTLTGASGQYVFHCVVR
jgi:hypothetical protein